MVPMTVKPEVGGAATTASVATGSTGAAVGAEVGAALPQETSNKQTASKTVREVRVDVFEILFISLLISIF